MNLILEIITLDYPVKLEQRGKKDSFRVTYGEHVKDHMFYDEAALEFGRCIMHSAACAGKLHNG